MRPRAAGRDHQRRFGEPKRVEGSHGTARRELFVERSSVSRCTGSAALRRPANCSGRASALLGRDLARAKFEAKLGPELCVTPYRVTASSQRAGRCTKASGEKGMRNAETAVDDALDQPVVVKFGIHVAPHSPRVVVGAREVFGLV